MRTNQSSKAKNTLSTLKASWAELFFSGLFAGIFTIGHMLSIGDVSTSRPKLFVYFFGFLVIFGIVFVVFMFLRHRTGSNARPSKKPFLARYSDNKLWLMASLATFLCYIPIILMITSVLTIDSWSSIGQIVGKDPLSAAHPLIFTAFSGVFVRLGLLFGSLELGTLFFSFGQSAILSVVFGRIIVWMRQEGVGPYGIIAAFIFYAVLPVNSFAGTIMWKDVLFAAFGLIFLVLLRELFVQRDRFFNRQNMTLFVFFAFLFCVWRNNGTYAYVLMLAILLLLDYKIFTNRKFAAALVSPVLLVAGYSLVTSLISKPAVSAEAMSVPLQQIARTVAYHGDELSNEDKASIDEILPYERLDDIYKPHISDPVKGSFRLSVFKDNEIKYINLWFKLFMEYRKTFISAFAYNTYGYVYPFRASPTTTDTIVDNSIQLNALEGYEDSAQGRGKSAAIAYRDLTMSIVPIFHNIGFYTCVILLCAYVAIIRKKRELTPVFILLACLFLTTILGPVNGEFRYLYLFVVATPFLLVSVVANRR